MTGMEGVDNPNATLPYASSLCGACYDVCPVKINIPEILVHLRSRDVDERRGSKGRFHGTWDVAMRCMSRLMSSPRAYDAAVRSSGLVGAVKRRGNLTSLPLPVMKDWTEFRDLPVPRESFRSWWDKREKQLTDEGDQQ